ncbi:rhodanese-like domain-containing protein [Desulfurivibrio alkaliphilus]|uniref:Rhodanese domain protein n=1 Tax=Desulfurivibrio alkaliphilus (strain DSM 19089 / UNIQEM U267 / AHT2) TaxID=589865 RepID=D6Z0Y3_DESAT|nr:rhodanese-like domain-containing protein [Desulfurivibrio alkaliphilus]ADH87243.1 Rhodanese domain protein [Desulfurivibrio alkaliphilus AHT 2]
MRFKNQNMKRSRLLSAICLTITLLLAAIPLYAAEFPGRSQYPAAQVISSDDLHRLFKADKAVLVDVRSVIEYSVIHPVGAVHINLSSLSFERETQELAAKHPGKQLAFYCNGVTCMRSYEASIRASESGVANTLAYDAGIPDWAVKFPADTLLLGQPITDPGKQLISDEAFAARNISFTEFRLAAAVANSMVIDVRDHVQRDRNLPDLSGVRHIPLDNFIPNFIERKANQDKKLLIFDQVGRQTLWLQYYLEANGYRDYAFLQGGAVAVLGTQEYQR